MDNISKPYLWRWYEKLALGVLLALVCLPFVVVGSYIGLGVIADLWPASREIEFETVLPDRDTLAVLCYTVYILFCCTVAYLWPGCFLGMAVGLHLLALILTGIGTIADFLRRCRPDGADGGPLAACFLSVVEGPWMFWIFTAGSDNFSAAPPMGWTVCCIKAGAKR